MSLHRPYLSPELHRPARSRNAQPLALLMLATVLPGCTGLPQEAPADIDLPERPNVIVMVADDLRADMLGAAGHPHAVTPNLDRLAREGVRFTQAFSVAGTCSPARASLLTGKAVAEHGVSHIMGRWYTFDRQETPFPVRLHQRGYQTTHIGKWHLGRSHLPHPGYDHWIGTPALRYFDSSWWVDGDETTLTDVPAHADLVMATLAARAIDTVANQPRRKRKQPFLLYVGFKAPHQPFQSDPRYDDFLADVTLPEPADLTPLNGVLDPLTARELSAFGGSYQSLAKAYLRTVRTLDDAVGIILDALDRGDLARDTLVVFTSDQGLALGEHGLIGKALAYDQTMHIPLLVRFPRQVPGGVTRDEVTRIVDIAPTVLDYAGFEPEPDLHGRSLRPLLESNDAMAPLSPPWTNDVFFEYWYYQHRGRRPAQVALRTDRHKLVSFRGRPRPVLFDLTMDPGEQTDVALDPAYADVLKDLRRRLRDRKAEVDWSPRIETPVRLIYALGPVASRMEAGRIARRYGIRPPNPQRPRLFDGQPLDWVPLFADSENRFHFEKLGSLDEGDTVLLSVPVGRYSERDPALVLRAQQDSPPLVGLVDGFEAWHFEPSLEERNWTDDGFNAPLEPGRNAVWLTTTIQAAHRYLSLRVVAPRNSVKLHRARPRKRTAEAENS